MLSNIFVAALAVSATLVSAASTENIVHRRHADKMVKVPLARKSGVAVGAGLGLNLDVDLSVQINAIVEEAISVIAPLCETVHHTVENTANLAVTEVESTLTTTFTTIESTLSGVVSKVGALSQSATTVRKHKRALDNQEVAATIANLLNTVAGAVNVAEGITGNLPIAGPILQGIYGKINGDLSLILTAVGTLLYGVVSLVKDLLNGILGPVASLPIIGNLLGGLLGGLL